MIPKDSFLVNNSIINLKLSKQYKNKKSVSSMIMISSKN